jgi:ADP-heptose:LPS heptosyltransferase
MSDPFAPGFLASLPRPPRTVVIVRASRIGDFICATPAFRALRQALPAAEITLIALPFTAELAVRSPHLDRFVPLLGFPGMAEQFFDARRVTRFFHRMQAHRFDLAIQFHGSGVYANPFTLMLGARQTVGFIRDGDPPGRLAAALPWPREAHEVDRALALTTFLGAPPAGTATEFPLREADRREAERLLTGMEPPLIGLHPGGREPAKRWPAERFAAVGQALRDRCGGTVVVLGGTAEAAIAASIAARVGGAVCDLTSRTSLPVLGAVIDRLAVLVSNDSAPAHIAYALGTPAVTLFGPTSPAEWGPPTTGPFRVLVATGDVAEIDAARVVAAAAEVMR